MSKTDRHRALNGVRARLDVDALLLTDPSDVRWACGFTGSSGWLLWTPWEAHFLTDGRYAIQAGAEVTSATIHVAKGGLEEALASLIPDACRSAAVSADTLTVAESNRLASRLPGIRWLPSDRFLAAERAQKTDAEVDACRRALRITECVFEEMLNVVRPGLTELEVAAEIVYRQLRRGAERMSFDPIVASGENSALPHARPSRRIIERGDLVLLDFGCVVDGYSSDMTRMISLGSPSPEVQGVVDTVRSALEAAAAAARSGIPACDLDSVARNVIETAGHGARFSHSLGHGVGLDIHEWPSISFRNQDDLPDRAVVTIEPGIYLEGRFGVRIEDMVLLGPDKADLLTRLSRDLVIL